eukprot:CAMPEP_0172374930 /NCGR_PEP_ID=MMETSP1060-20121228/58377_1 /TAXON_ID=37318 /ORGANISM="Pseudo-nitzschia pungens, Strain cf. cingulata" /LENGTH=1613 /DNA_ID=CAMNT_0013101809 /DNA_START=228 /DNA_END=5069 /DNA_ORIENTATION=+
MSLRNINKKVEVATGVYLQGRQLEEFCQQRGRCPLCAKTKVKKRGLRVFGSKRWEPITVVRTKVAESLSSPQRKKKKSFFSPKKGGNRGGEKETVEEYLVYKGFCLREGCFTLTQAKRMANCDRARIASAVGKAKSKSAWSTNLASEHTINEALRKQNSSSSRSCHQSYPRSRSISSQVSVSTSTDSDKDTERTKSTFPPLQFRLQFVDENCSSSGNHFSVNYPQNKGICEDEDGDECDHPTSSENAPPISIIIDQTFRTLQGKNSTIGASMIRTIDLTGIRLRVSEMEVLAEGLQTNMTYGVVHLSSLILKNCGIDNNRLDMLGTALADALRPPKKTCGGDKLKTGSPIAKFECTHAMRLKRLDLSENNIGAYGLEGICHYLESSACRLETLNLSRNHIETMGGVSIFNAFRRNLQTRIRVINLSYNLLRKLDADDENNPNLSNNELEDSDDIAAYHCKSFFSPSFGIYGFLAQNRTIQELNLSGNRMRNRGVEALCGGLCIAGRQASLSILRLGYNRIGDSGAKAIGSCLTINRSLTLIELNDNGIHNDGGMSLLSAMGRNTTVTEISGLWSNNIDRRYIIVSIRRLLLSMERGQSECDRFDDDCEKVETEESDDEDGDDVDEEREYGYGTKAIEISDDDGIDPKNGRSGDRSCNRLPGEERQEYITPRKKKGFDHQHENISDLSDDEKNETGKGDDDEIEKHRISQYEILQAKDCNDRELATDGMMETNQEMSQNVFDRMTVLNSAPLVFYEKQTGVHKTIPLHDAKREIETIREAVAVAITKGSKIEVREETATLNNFKAFFTRGESPVLHFSCNGLEDAIMLENGHGYLMKISFENLEELVSSGGGILQVVFVSSCHALAVGQAFIDAGVPHVVCCQREAAFRDPIATEFAKYFYRNAAKQKTVIESFETAVQEVLSSRFSENLRQVAKRFHLLRSSTEVSTPIFFNKVVADSTNNDIGPEQCWKIPPLSDHFLGRELDMFKILEKIEANDCVNIYGSPGHGKDCIVSAVIGHVVGRRRSFSIDHAYWIPAPELVTVEPDSLYGDLNICCDLIKNSSEDLWDTGNETLLDCRERLEIELDEVSIAVVIDSRVFSSKGSQAAMRKFAKFILTNARVAKIISISTTRETGDSRSCNVEINALDLRSVALLFGKNSHHISKNKCNLARSAEEFAELVEQPFGSHAGPLLPVGSQRRTEIFRRMGNGFPKEVISIARSMSQDEFNDLMKLICKPEINVDCLRKLEIEISRWKGLMDLAVKEKNYSRAADLLAFLDQLEKMRLEFPSLKDLKDREHLMKLDLADAVSNRQYDVANELKKDLLDLKKTIMKERRISSMDGANEMLNGIKAKVDSIVADTKDDSIESEEFQTSKEATPFEVDCDGRVCKFLIYSGTVFDLDGSNNEKSKSKGIVCWSNESCELDNSFFSKSLLKIDSDELNECIAKLPIVKETQYGPVVCENGSSLILENKADHSPSEINRPSSTRSLSMNGGEVVILTVGPFWSTSGQIELMLERDCDFLHFSEVTARSCYRSCITQANEANLQILAISLLTTRTASSRIYKEMLRIGLQTLTEEAKFSLLQEVHVIAKDPQETAKLVEMMQMMGYASSQKTQE